MKTNLTPDLLAERLKQLSENELQEFSKRNSQKADKDYNEFASMFGNGQCSICNKPLKTFSDHTCLKM